MKLRKGLIITAAFALVAVSCTKGGNTKKHGWSDFLKLAMKECFGEVLPYTQLNNDTLYYGFSTESGVFCIGDDNETNLMDDYGAKLEKNGFECVEPEPAGEGEEGEGEEEAPYYYKETEYAAMAVTPTYYEETVEYEAGNEIYVGFERVEQTPVASVDMKIAGAYFNQLGIKGVPAFPSYEGEELTTEMNCNYGLPGIYEIDIFNSSQAQMEAYAESLESKGWTVGEGEYVGDFLAYYGQTGAYVELQNWIGYSYDCIRILLYESLPPLPPEEGFPVQHVLQYLANEGLEDGIAEDDFAPYPEQENTEYVFDDSNADYYGGCDVYITNTTSVDCANYVDALVDDYGWTLDDVIPEYDEADDELVVATTYKLTFVTGESKDVFMTVYDYLYEYQTVDLFIGLKVHKEEGTGAFPLEALNTFIEQYDLGFTLTAGLEGDNFTFSTFENGGYHCFQIILDGDNVTAFKNYVNDTLIAAEYSLDTDTATRVTYNNADWHQIDIGYVSASGYTYMNFWE